MELGLSSCESSDVEDERPDVLDDAIKDTKGWVDLERARKVPKLLINNIHRYFITKKVRKDQVTASRPFERGYRIYDAKRVRCISIHTSIDDSLFSVIRASVLPSQKTDRIYQTFIVVYNTSGDIYYATCSCTAGEGGSCNHVAGLCFAMDDYNRLRTSQTPSCTSLPSKWNVPRNTKDAKDIPVSDLHIMKPSYLKPRRTELSSPSSSRPISPQLSQVTIERVMKLRQDLSDNCTDTLQFHQIWPESINQAQVSRLHALHLPTQSNTQQ